MTEHNQPEQTPLEQTPLEQTPPPLPGQPPQVDWNETPQPQEEAFNPQLPAWEQAGSFLGAFCKTTWQVLFKPYLTFQRVAYPGTGSLIAFALPWMVLFTAFSILYDQTLQFTFLFFISTLLSATVLFIISLLITHLSLKVVRADKNGLKATFRACAYMCCIYIWVIIPWIGSLLAVIWGFAIFFSMLAASQEVTRMRILGALLVYLAIIFCIFLIVVMIVGMAAITQMFNTMMQGGQSPFPW